MFIVNLTDTKSNFFNEKMMSKTVLIAEDDSSICHMISDIVVGCGCNVITAYNGEKAISQYKEHHPDLILMDISMPQKDGDEASSEIKKLNPDAKIILMTAFGREWVNDCVKTKGILGVLHKPFEMATLQKLLEKYL